MWGDPSCFAVLWGKAGDARPTSAAVALPCGPEHTQLLLRPRAVGVPGAWPRLGGGVLPAFVIRQG